VQNFIKLRAAVRELSWVQTKNKLRQKQYSPLTIVRTVKTLSLVAAKQGKESMQEIIGLSLHDTTKTKLAL